nr:hypothetical protein DGKKSRWO_DGKKSRWO_CDS_0026 [uncultured phage]CAI9752149.1 hypothetical protein CVNMHQAP_CVNMHQAP_CDS_0026 [uncultured phage]
MKVYQEINLEEFQFWGSAEVFTSKLTSEEFKQLEENFNELYPDGISATDLNDIFSFDSDNIAKYLGYEDAFDLICSRD